MKFYTINNLKNNDSISSSGIDIMLMSKAFKIISKETSLKTVDETIQYSFIFLDDKYSIKDSENVRFNYSSKKINFSLIDDNKIFEIKDTNNSFFAVIHADSLKINSNMDELIKIINTPTIESNNSIEQKVIHWLDNGKVGLSSGTMCAALFPQLKNHTKLVDLYDYDDNRKASSFRARI